MEMFRPKEMRLDRHEIPENFVGKVGRAVLARASAAGGLDVALVDFEAGARTVGHVHEGDQILFAVSGRGAVWTELSTTPMEPGDWVVIPSGTLHWHGADGSESFQQVAIKSFGFTDWRSELTALPLSLNGRLANDLLGSAQLPPRYSS